jgi:hypothetical protein
MNFPASERNCKGSEGNQLYHRYNRSPQVSKSSSRTESVNLKGYFIIVIIGHRLRKEIKTRPPLRNRPTKNRARLSLPVAKILQASSPLIPRNIITLAVLNLTAGQFQDRTRTKQDVKHLNQGEVRDYLIGKPS